MKITRVPKATRFDHSWHMTPKIILIDCGKTKTKNPKNNPYWLSKNKNKKSHSSLCWFFTSFTYQIFLAKCCHTQFQLYIFCSGSSEHIILSGWGSCWVTSIWDCLIYDSTSRMENNIFFTSVCDKNYFG